MNYLSVNPTSENGLSFELTVDGKPLSALLNDSNSGIPYWLVDDGIPTWPPSGPNADPNILIVTVCNCGEYGCGHSRCNVSIEEGVVKFSNFQGNVNSKESSLIFAFPEAEYRHVVAQMVQLTREYTGSSS